MLYSLKCCEHCCDYFCLQKKKATTNIDIFEINKYKWGPAAHIHYSLYLAIPKCMV